MLQSHEKCNLGITFEEVLEATSVLLCFVKPERKLKVIAKSTITLHTFFMLKEIRNIQNRSNKRLVIFNWKVSL